MNDLSIAGPARSGDRQLLRHTQVEANGGHFHVVEQGEGPAVLFVPGFPDTWTTWRRQMAAVASAGWIEDAARMRFATRDEAADR